MLKIKPPIKALPLAIAAALAACGGGNGSNANGGNGGTLTISAATPSSNNTTLDLSKAATIANSARAADGFSSTPYCEVFFEGVPGANGVTYAVQVYFRQSDKAPLNASVVGGNPPSFVIFDNNSGNPIAGLTVNTTVRTIVFNNKAMTGSPGSGTVNGTVNFPSNSGTPACGT